MRVNLGRVYAAAFGLVFVAAVLVEVLADTFNKGFMLSMMFVLGVGQVMAVFVYSKRVNLEPEQEQQPKEEKKPMFSIKTKLDEKPVVKKEDEENKLLIEYIIEKIRGGMDLNSILLALKESGYEESKLATIVNHMVNVGLIQIEQKKQEPKQEPQEETKPEEVTEQLDKDIEEEKKSKKKETKEDKSNLEKEERKEEMTKCPKCGKEFDSEKKMRRHYGMSHYAEIEM